jgi:carbonic anhydrase/acetyltransferase-like protein (isoleucine patch superfamily)
VVYEDARVSENVQVWGYARVKGNARVFGNARVLDNTRVGDNAEVSGYARVYNNAVVFGNARVSGYAEVYCDAMIYGDARVYNDARIYGDSQIFGSFNFTPFQLQGSKHYINQCDTNKIRIGCITKKIDEWVNKCEEIGLSQGYSQKEIKEYKIYIDAIKRLSELNPSITNQIAFL